MSKLANPYSRPSLSKCYKYNQQGHQSIGWPLYKSMNIIKINDVREDEEVCVLDDDDDDDDGDDDHHHEEEFACVVRKLMVSQKSGDDS